MPGRADNRRVTDVASARHAHPVQVGARHGRAPRQVAEHTNARHATAAGSRLRVTVLAVLLAAALVTVLALAL